jgi:putative hydrolase of the HAD superfamily
MEATRLTCVLFDLYGTLVDVRLNEDAPTLWAGLAAVVRELGGALEHSSDVRDRFRQILDEEARHGREGFLLEPTFRRLLACFGAGENVAHLGREFRRLSAEELTLRSYVAPLYEQLHRSGCTIGIVSNTESVLTQFDLDYHPLLFSSDTIVLSSEVGVRKPDVRIFEIALDRLHAAAEAAVFVGNSMAEDIEGARRAGLRAIHLDDGATGIAPLTRDVLRVRPSLSTLKDALQRFGWHTSARARSAR